MSAGKWNEIRDAGCGIPAFTKVTAWQARCDIRDTRYGIRDTGYGIKKKSSCHKSFCQEYTLELSILRYGGRDGGSTPSTHSTSSVNTSSPEQRVPPGNDFVSTNRRLWHRCGGRDGGSTPSTSSVNTGSPEQRVPPGDHCYAIFLVSIRGPKNTSMGLVCRVCGWRCFDIRIESYHFPPATKPTYHAHYAAP